MRSPPRGGSVPQRLPRRDGRETFRKGWVTQHSAFDLETYARLYVEDRLRDSEKSRQASQVPTGASLLARVAASLQSWVIASLRGPVSPAPAVSAPVQFVSAGKQEAAHADPYVGMIVLARGSRKTCSLDAA